jgi:fido (protein-threonine AMPylation protein)
VDHPCPQAWAYEKHPKRKKLVGHVADVLKRLRSKNLDSLKVAKDSRSVHGDLFKDLTPPHFAYYAGHYRGEPFRCLATCEVFLPGDPRVGAPAAEVADRMKELAAEIDHAVTQADRMFVSSAFGAHEKLLHVVGLACQVFDLFLQVHPYANGNGHAARFITWAILGRYGFWPVRWTIEPRPADPPYTPLLRQHRAGDRQPLVEFVLNCIK